MTKLQSVIRYICQNYPHRGELSKARLTKLVYLADWRSAQMKRQQLTPIQWLFNRYGPYVEDVVEAAKTDPTLRVVQTTNYYGTPKVLIQVDEDAPSPNLSSDERKIIDDVIRETSPLAFNAFIGYVYGTYPVRTADKYDILNLPALATDEMGERSKVSA